MQTALFKIKTRLEYGGDKAKGKRKQERPFSRRNWIHLILKSDKAQGKLSLQAKRNRDFIQKLIEHKARAFGVNVADYANVSTHLHLKVKAGSRLQFQKFLRSISGRIARHVTGARKGRPFGRFWKHLAYTRILKSRLEELHLTGYFEANRREAQDGYAARTLYLHDFHAWVRRAQSSQ